ncbi:MAG: lycopene cyclase family protein [Planctomycetota bacterium]
MSDERADIAILGGGCAGLSLAVQLVERGLDGVRVVVLEQRPEYVRDRTWCGWSVVPHAFQDCVDHAWSRWQVRGSGECYTHSSARYRYEHIPADRFYASAQERIAASSGAALRTGVDVHGVHDLGGSHRIRTSSGDVVAETIVDARSSSPRRVSSGLLQHFRGWEVTTAAPVFDPETVTLMDFDVVQDDGAVHFLYVLPFSPTRALVESTVLSPDLLPEAEYEARIEEYVARRFGTRIQEIGYVEAGAIPMTTDAMPPDARGPRAGTAGGAVKASSGYAFHAIQRTTAELATRLLAGTASGSVAARSRLDAWMDGVFLSFLQHNPERGAEVFLRLFRSVDSDTIVRFMMEVPTTTDRLQFVTAMPKTPFMREALRSSVA